MTTAAPNITEITQADLDAYFATDQTGYCYPPSNEERFEAWLRLSGYQGIYKAASRSELIATLVAAATHYAAWLQENPYCTQAGRAVHNRQARTCADEVSQANDSGGRQ